MVPLALATLLSWTTFFSLPDQKLHVSFLDVGQGDAILIRTPSYKVLLDGGPSPQALTRYLGQKLPFWDRRIDLVILSHPHDDHLMGLMEVLQRYQVGAILASPYDYDSSLYRQWRSLVKAKGIAYVQARRGQEVRLGAQGRIEVLYPGERLLQGTDSDANNNSVVLRLTWGSFSVLLPGDVQEEGQADLLGKEVELASLVLKVPHQGARNALGNGFLDRVQPQVAIISVGKGNPFGHPAPETIQKLQGMKVYRTDRNGSLEVEADGRGYRILPERP